MNHVAKEMGPVNKNRPQDTDPWSNKRHAERRAAARFTGSRHLNLNNVTYGVSIEEIFTPLVSRCKHARLTHPDVPDHSPLSPYRSCALLPMPVRTDSRTELRTHRQSSSPRLLSCPPDDE
jgi:hypothetical protein